MGVLMIGLALALLAGAITFVITLIRNNRTPTVSIPTATMPTPNAFDTYVAAGKAIVRKDEISSAFAEKNQGQKLTDDQKAALVDANREPLKAIRTGLALPYRQPSLRSLSDPVPYYKDFTYAGRLIALESRVYAARGDVGKAMESALDGIQFGKHLGTGASLIGGLVSLPCQSSSRHAAWDIRDRLDATQAKAATQRLQNLRKMGVSYTDILIEEKYKLQSCAMEIFRDPKKYPADASGDKNDSPQNADARATTLSYFWSIYGKQRSMDNVTRAMDAAIAQSKRRYIDDHAPIPEPKDLISAILLPEVSTARLRFAANETQDALLTLDLALRAYKGENGQYPATLEALVPRYLPELPVDPFARSGSPRYRVTPDGFLLYSIGPDGKDDNGEPIENPEAKTEREKRLVRPSSPGDIVAGVNF